MSIELGAYTADQIETTTNLEQIRRRPAGFIGTKDIAGQVHMIREIIDNSVDELILRPEGGFVDIVLFRDLVHNKYQLLIADNGRGIPSQALVRATTVLGSSGKTKEDGVYLAAGGQFGYGLKAAAALSSKFRILSVNNTEEIGSSLYLEDGKTIEHTTAPVNTKYGVRVLFEPDLSFFIDGAEFMTSGYLEVIKLCKQLNIFNEHIYFRFSIVDRLVVRTFWKADIPTALSIIDRIILDKSKTIEYDAVHVYDKSVYLFEGVWKCTSNVIFSHMFHKDPVDAKDRLGFDIKLYFSRKASTNSAQYFISVNNVRLPDATGNSATTTFLKVLSQRLVELLPEAHRDFFLESYRFSTMLLAIGIRYNGAELSGITKTSFKDSNFAKQFETELEQQFNQLGKDFWEVLGAIIRAEVELRYSQFYETPPKKNEGKKTFADLNFPGNYKECKSGDPSVTELFIVEGTSAANINETRNNQFQAVYTTRGKPTNGATELKKVKENRDKLLKDPIYQDILKILNITPNTKDIRTARFGKLIITSDADPDGYHIRSIHLNNLYIINPLIITSGMVWIANPPLYSMNINKNKRLFLRDKNALMDARIQYIYQPSFELKVQSTSGIQELHPAVFRECCYLIHHIGNAMQVTAEQLNIPLLILERLALNIQYLYPAIQFDKLASIFKSSDNPDFIRVQINKEQRFIVVSVGHEDYMIGLDAIGDTLVNHLLPILRKYKFYQIMFLLRTKYAGSLYQEWTPMSWMMVYSITRELDKMFQIKRYKGLGEMKSDDCFETLMNPATRALTHITSLGDVDMNYSLLGKNSIERKKLLTDTNLLHHNFYKDN